jgi:predicted nucleic acid-binding protein
MVYLDATVLLRRILRQPGALEHPGGVAASSALLEVECFRSIDRWYLRGLLDERDLADARAIAFKALRAVRLVDVNADILARASAPFPTPLATLDALHLATALRLRERHGAQLRLATHDLELTLCARALGLDVIGT